MLDNIKGELTKSLTEELEKYSILKSKFSELEKKILNDNCEDDYALELKEIKDKYKKPSEEEQIEITKLVNELNINYKMKIDEFNNFYNEYVVVKEKLSKINVFLIKSKIDKISSAEKLLDLGMDIEKAREFCEEHDINFVVDLETM